MVLHPTTPFRNQKALGVKIVAKTIRNVRQRVLDSRRASVGFVTHVQR